MELLDVRPANDTQLQQDEHWMREALKWSLRGKGWTSPRPSVGCVLVRDGQIIGGGHTQKGNGQPHAEVMALNMANKNGNARGATAYVTLEPCSHYATTPPCSSALIEKGIKRVVAGVLDPNPAVAGNGFRMMREAGVEVVEGVLAADCGRAMDEFLFSIVRNTPFVCLKSAVSLDGKIALPSGESKWITGPQARARAHKLRHHADAVLVGIETVLQDDPSLSVRLDENATQPIRIVLDSMARLPLGAKIWDDAPALIVAVSPDAPLERLKAFQSRGATVIECERDTMGRLAWQPFLEDLARREIISLLIEGGARVAGSALRAGIVDKVAWFVAPLLMGVGKSALGDYEVENLSVAPRLSLVQTQTVGDDVLIEGYLKPIPGM
ncbi:bifunctional diaminohydroxyphosphoribosylaminopyrimidine deaminase/5-amino-6-(5-phosphoribosylamino)uracil reductase RibD [bacterium]|nr:MAG: bifunctional diaminohydroxyphosphoribosylaminopyrimidine deaminase/5-amino-6-(5-phosphoribosylamino)uracil reductase RibD [bacterium]